MNENTATNTRCLSSTRSHQRRTREHYTSETESKRQYDKTAKPLIELQIGQHIKLQPISRSTPWNNGKCVDTNGSRSYLIELDSGQVVRRNRKHLRASTHEPEVTNNNADTTSNPTKDVPAIPEPAKTSDLVQPAESQINTGQTFVKSTHSRSNIKPPSKYNDFILN